MKIRPVGAEFHHEDTNVTKLIVAFHSCAKALKNTDKVTNRIYKFYR